MNTEVLFGGKAPLWPHLASFLKPLALVFFLRVFPLLLTTARFGKIHVAQRFVPWKPPVGMSWSRRFWKVRDCPSLHVFPSQCKAGGFLHSLPFFGLSAIASSLNITILGLVRSFCLVSLQPHSPEPSVSSFRRLLVGGAPIQSALLGAAVGAQRRGSSGNLEPPSGTGRIGAFWQEPKDVKEALLFVKWC